MAQPFDAKAMKTTGEPVPLAEQIGTDAVGLARFSVSRDGVLAYRTGESGNRMIWLDRSGKEIDTVGSKGDSQDPQFSPAGDQLAFDLVDERSGKSDIWIRDLARGVSSRFTFDPVNAYSPVWTPRGDAIVYASEREGAPGLYEKSMLGQGEEKLLLKAEALTVPVAIAPDGSALLYIVRDPKTSWNIMVLPRTGEAKPIPFRATPFNEGNPNFSPDGKFISYNSNESGRNEVYVQSYPGPGRTWQVSTAGGSDAAWRQDGKELYYRESRPEADGGGRPDGRDISGRRSPALSSRRRSPRAPRARSTFRTGRGRSSCSSRRWHAMPSRRRRSSSTGSRDWASERR